MKRIVLLFLTAILLSACGRHKEELHIVPLTAWQFEYNGLCYSATVPGCVHTDLMDNGVIPDPFYGTNEDSVQWVGERNWDYYLPLTKEMWKGYRHCELVLEGVTLCDVMLEGRTTDGVKFQHIVMHCDNMFREWRVDLSELALTNGSKLLSDSVMLHIIFYPIARNNELLFDPDDNEDALSYDLPDHRVATRMAPYMLGWDWGPRLSTVGITVDAHLECYNEPPTLVAPEVPTSWGITLEQQEDSIGRSFTFMKEGKPIFVKGANWIPCHSFPVLTKTMRERYRMLLYSAKECNINMLRVWGGGIYEPDYFYDLCDSLGIMVWQDFNFSCAPYPGDSLMLDNISEEARYQVRRIAQHPCVVLWCGNNEVKNGWEDWGWQGQYKWSEQQRREIEHTIDTIFGYSTDDNTSQTSILAMAVRDCDPLQRPYITTSPLYGWGHDECVTHGDSHYWGVWWGEQPFEMYEEKTGRFMSEYGFQSYPDYSTVLRYCPADQLNIDSPTMRSHQKHPRGVAIIDKAMKEYYGLDSRSVTLEDYCYLSQILQAWGVGYGIWQHLKQQPHCMGTLYWQLNDCWPVASWSSIDYYGNWKALQYRVRDLFSDDVDLNKYEHYYATYPKDLQLPKAVYTIEKQSSKKELTVTVTATSALRDVMLQTVPHVDGHFDDNYFDMDAGTSRTVRFVANDPNADLSAVKVTTKTLNEVMSTYRH
ncbi:MAG: hypothetical protein K5864_08565 [Bacteroidales bacterium]|nr:hypothetical protein [Bacteroidales bacterium]